MTFSIRFPVRYSDVDERSVVNNAKYLTYFEEARMALLDHIRAERGMDVRGQLIVARMARLDGDLEGEPGQLPFASLDQGLSPIDLDADAEGDIAQVVCEGSRAVEERQSG